MFFDSLITYDILENIVKNNNKFRIINLDKLVSDNVFIMKIFDMDIGSIFILLLTILLRCII